MVLDSAITYHARVICTASKQPYTFRRFSCWNIGRLAVRNRMGRLVSTANSFSGVWVAVSSPEDWKRVRFCRTTDFRFQLPSHAEANISKRTCNSLNLEFLFFFVLDSTHATGDHAFKANNLKHANARFLQFHPNQHCERLANDRRRALWRSDSHRIIDRFSQAAAAEPLRDNEPDSPTCKQIFSGWCGVAEEEPRTSRRFCMR